MTPDKKPDKKQGIDKLLERAEGTLGETLTQYYLLFNCYEKTGDATRLNKTTFREYKLEPIYKTRKEAEQHVNHIILPKLSKWCQEQNPDKPKAIKHEILNEEEYEEYKHPTSPIPSHIFT